MSQRPAIDPSALAQVLQRYPDLGQLEAVEANGLSINTAACVFRTTTGRYFAKRYDPVARPAAAIAAEHALIDRLVAADFPTPKLYRNDRHDGATWLAEMPYALMDIAEGEGRYASAAVFAPYGSLAEAKAAGAMLARFHAILTGAPDRPVPQGLGLSVATRAWAADSLETGLAEALVGDFPKLPATMGEREGWHDTFHRFAKRHKAIHAVWPKLPAGILHGDWIKRNLFWKDQSVAAVVDFDLFAEGPFVYDLALALLPTGFDWPELLKGSSQSLRLADMAAFLEGYASERPLSAEERQILPTLMEGCRLEFYLRAIGVAGVRELSDMAELFWGLLAGTIQWFDQHPSWDEGFALQPSATR